MKNNKVVSALLGVAVGDALGVPFEFRSRENMRLNPAKEMTGYGTYNQPPGTWSDDSSLTFCLAESLLEGLDLMDISSKFIAWRERSYWTARNRVFDIGRTTSLAITRLQTYLKSLNYEKLSTQKYEGSEYDNGNGSLMRILPLLFYI
ncbi:MAG: ADP-ribosylglycohydrolase family protein, partial [Saprospiraceae bacterium]